MCLTSPRGIAFAFVGINGQLKRNECGEEENGMTAQKNAGFAPERLLDVKVADIMTRNPVSIEATASIQDLVAVLTERSISGLPVINETGRPVGVVSQADVLIHDREKREYLLSVADTQDWGDPDARPSKEGDASGRFAIADPTTVAEIMTPVVFSVTPDTPARKAIEDMVDMKVHRLFVVDKGGALVGVISPLDVLRYIV